MEPAENPGGVNLLSLLQSGKFSDLQLSCEGRNFAVHKNILCEQSSVINALCEGSFKESRTNVIKIEDFKADTVHTMLEFLYCRNYSVSPNLGPEFEIFSGEVVGLDEPTKRQRRLCWHLNLNAIGDYYDVQGLCNLARSKVKKEFEAVWSCEDFIYLYAKTCPTQKTGDIEFYRLLGQIAAEHQEDLVQLWDLDDLDIPTAFFMSFVSSSIERVRSLEERIRSRPPKKRIVC